ncbi:MAG: hypothetical protein AB1801_01630 [Chloroflexota bacterium]
MITNQPNTAQIRRLLTTAFDDPGLDAFCQDYFPTVFDRFSRGMRKDEKINWLLDHCRRKPTGFAQLIQALRDKYQTDEAMLRELEPLCPEALQDLSTDEIRRDMLEPGPMIATRWRSIGAISGVIIAAIATIAALAWVIYSGSGGSTVPTPTDIVAVIAITPSLTPTPTETQKPTKTPELPTDTPTWTSTPAPTLTDTPIPPLRTLTPTQTDTLLLPTATPTLTPTNTPIPPTVTPTPLGVCDIKVDNNFVSLWEAERPQHYLGGCPTDSSQTISRIVEQRFEGGHIFWRADKNEIYVVYDCQMDVSGRLAERPEDKWLRFEDPGYEIKECSPVLPPPASSERRAPEGGIKTIWCINTDVQQKLGWAMDRHYEFYDIGKIQFFEGGFMFKGSSPKIYALLYTDGRNKGDFFASGESCNP